MLGVVGNIKICYNISGNNYEEIINPQEATEFSLKCCEKIKFRVEEITYVVDTVYGVELSLIEPQFREYEYTVGTGITDFSIEEYGVYGEISLCFFGGNT